MRRPILSPRRTRRAPRTRHRLALPILAEPADGADRENDPSASAGTAKPRRKSSSFGDQPSWNGSEAQTRCILRGDQLIPRVSELRRAGRDPACVRLPQDAHFCTRRAGVRLTPGAHAFVLVPGEQHLRMSASALPFGSACGHPQLACEGRVLFAGELLIGEAGRLLAWSNASGTYKPPRELAAQVDLPLELLWVVVSPGELRADCAVSASAAHTVSARQLDARYGVGNHRQLPSGFVLVRDVARCPLREAAHARDVAHAALVFSFYHPMELPANNTSATPLAALLEACCQSLSLRQAQREASHAQPLSNKLQVCADQRVSVICLFFHAV